MKYTYEVLIAQTDATGVEIWHRGSDGKPLGSNLPLILNQFGEAGWHVVATGDFAASARSEIILEKS